MPVLTTASHRPTNRLIHATSPYLLQHAHNPVDWYEWGPEALERARNEEKPIFLSIGYSACHWCHVMERESFENDDIARVMNEHFVNIKVDREERPDLDAIYMAATQALTRSGGWPMSVWLTPELKPFYAGTYFPPDDRYGRPGFKRVLEFLALTWREDRDKALAQAEQLTEAVRALSSVEGGDGIASLDLLSKSATMLGRMFDPVNGGMTGGGTNKFPPSMAMDLMLRVYHSSTQDGGANAEAKVLLERVETTLEKMAHGGIYDQLGGGIARYSTDTEWLVPHFEKMLYDQALVSDIYLKTFQVTKNPLYARVAREIFDYVITDLQSPEGGFYSTRDADSEGVEGKFYVWSRGEVESLLGAGEAGLFCDYYDVTAEGNWEGHNILNVKRPLSVVVKLHRLTESEAEGRLAEGRKKLFEAREKRVKPHLDDKVLASWNGLMIASLAKGSRILGDKKYAASAARAAEFVLTKMTKEDRLQRTYRQGRAHTGGYLDDYACMIEGLLNLYEAAFDLNWLDHAERLNDIVLARFRDEKDGGFYFTADDAERVLVRSKEAGDGAVPSGNSVQVMNLLRLAVLLDRKAYLEEAERSFKAFSKNMEQSPFQSERMLSALDFYYRRPKELAFVSWQKNVERLDVLIDASYHSYVPNVVMAKLIVDGPDAKRAAKRISLLAGKKAPNEGAWAYVCKNFACQAPVSEEASLVNQIQGR